MGCDIHLYVELKNESGKWDLLFEPLNPNMRRHKFLQDFPPCEEDGDSKFIISQFKLGLTPITYAHRNYDLFGLLAGVRSNRYPMANASTGVPKNASKTYKDFVKGYGVDGHSHSYINFDSLLSYNWDHIVIEQDQFFGVEISEFIVNNQKSVIKTVDNSNARYQNVGIFTNTSGPVYDLLQASMHQRVELLRLAQKDPQAVFTCIAPQTIRSIENHFLNFIQGLTEKHNPANLRLCYFFDN